MEPNNPVDTSIKALLRQQPHVLFRLQGRAQPSGLRWDDSVINQFELRADHVLVLGDAAGGDSGALYLEYQLAPDASLLSSWAAKWTGLLRQLGLPVALLVLYLERGGSATFPDRLHCEVEGVSTEYRFTTIKLWEHADRIRSGELWELAPLLVLCEDNPTEATMRREVTLITTSPATEAQQANMLAYALRIGARDFSRSVLEGIFREMLPMVKSATVIDDWIAEGEARGEVRGAARGRLEEARELALRLLRKRFPDLPERLARRVEALELAECTALIDGLFDGAALNQLFPD